MFDATKYIIDNVDIEFNYEAFWKRFKKELNTAQRPKPVMATAFLQLNDNFSAMKRFEFDFENEYPQLLSVFKECKAELKNNQEENIRTILDRFFNKTYTGLYYDEINHINYHTVNNKKTQLDIDTMLFKMKNEGILGVKGINKDDVYRYLKIPDTIHRMNPLRQFFEKLPQWDGTDHAARYISLFDVVENIEGINRKEFIINQYIKYLIRIVNQAFGNSTMKDINKCSLLYLSPTNSGKTSFIKTKQFPDFIREYFFTSNFTFDTKDNNSIKKMISQLIIYIDDFNGFANKKFNPSKKDINQFKILTGNENFDLKENGKKQTYKRIGSFIFSANHESFSIPSDDLMARFLILEFANDTDHKLPFDKWNQNDTLLMWSQVMHLWNKDNNAGMITDEESAINRRINETYRYRTVVDLESLIKIYIKPGTPESGLNYTSSELEALLKKSTLVPEQVKVQINQRALGHYLQKILGVKQIFDGTKACRRAYRLIIKL